MGKCIIMGAGEFCNEQIIDKKSLTLDKEDFCIAADGGFAYLQAIGITPPGFGGRRYSPPVFSQNSTSRRVAGGTRPFLGRMIPVRRTQGGVSSRAAIW